MSRGLAGCCSWRLWTLLVAGGCLGKVARSCCKAVGSFPLWWWLGGQACWLQKLPCWEAYEKCSSFPDCWDTVCLQCFSSANEVVPKKGGKTIWVKATLQSAPSNKMKTETSTNYTGVPPSLKAWASDCWLWMSFLSATLPWSHMSKSWWLSCTQEALPLFPVCWRQKWTQRTKHPELQMEVSPLPRESILLPTGRCRDPTPLKQHCPGCQQRWGCQEIHCHLMVCLLITGSRFTKGRWASSPFPITHTGKRGLGNHYWQSTQGLHLNQGMRD